MSNSEKAIEGYYREISTIIEELASIFDPLCAELCSGCAISCCNDCVKEMGYYRDKQIEDLKSKYSFDEKKGFLGAQGCCIPRPDRSERCLYHICLRIQMNVIKEKGPTEFASMKERVTELSEQHGRIISKYEMRQ